MTRPFSRTTTRHQRQLNDGLDIFSREPDRFRPGIPEGKCTCPQSNALFLGDWHFPMAKEKKMG